MTGPSPLLDRAGLERALRRLGERLMRRGVVAELYVVGGAAMALAYDARRVTRDVDALFVPHGAVLDEARAVAAELGLPPWWLNDQASSYMAAQDAGSRSLEFPGLRVSVASPEHLLAMKVLASRLGDRDDIRHLVTVLGLRTVDEVLGVARRVFPDETPPERARLLVEDLLVEGPADDGR